MDNKREIQEHQYQQPYHWMLSKNVKALFDLRSQIVLTMIQPVSGKKCLDIGCGDGKFTSILATHAAEVVGIDISDRALCFAKCLVPNAKFLKMDATHLQFPKDFFDVVTCVDVLEHLPDDCEQQAIAEMSRVLKGGGFLVVSVPSKNKRLEEKHYRHYTVNELQTVLKKQFSEISLTGCGLYVPLLTKFLNYPKMWKLINKVIVKESIPTNALTLIARATKR